jgi:hypothetical protein
VQLLLCVSDAEIEAATWTIADTDHVVKQLEREASGITWKDQMRFLQKFSIRLVEFEAWWHAMSIQQIRKTIKQHVIHFGYAMLNLVSHLPQSILRMGSGNNYPTNISE